MINLLELSPCPLQSFPSFSFLSPEPFGTLGIPSNILNRSADPSAKNFSMNRRKDEKIQNLHFTL